MHPLRLLLAVVVPAAGLAAAVAPPAGLAMVANSADSITLAWRRPAAEVTSYKVLASAAKDGEYRQIAAVPGLTAVHTGLPATTTRWYRVVAVGPDGDSAPSPPAQGFTITPTPGAPFPVRVAGNMCVSLGATVVSDPPPREGRLASLVDGSDATSCLIPGPCEVRIRLDPAIAIADAAYLLLNFRSETAGKFFISYDTVWRAPRTWTVVESLDSTDGRDGTWSEVASGTNAFIDGVISIPNHKPRWLGLRNSAELQLCRLDVFRAAPAGQRNDYWIFTGDSLVVQDFSGGNPAAHGVWFSDLVRQRHPDRYPIVVQAARGGEMLKDTLSRMRKTLPALSPANGSGTPTATIVCWETGFNDVGIGGGLWMGERIGKALGEAQDLCQEHGLVMVPVRIEFSTGYLDPASLEPKKDNIHYNTLAVNLAGVDVFCRARAPWACDPATQLPYADYWGYTRENHATALAKDGVHHTREGADGINRLWAEIAGKMVYRKP